ncbi:MAG: alpha/beta fold hydrolase [Actinomycetota bacterium]|nr:alpha/beta fold hydrolase [Actinomycetota bacterium]
MRLATGPRLHYAEQGNPKGEAIIFLHGALHKKSGVDTRRGSSILNKTPCLVVACNFAATPLHGYSDSWYSYSRVLPLLSPEYHAFASDQRGHGVSDKPQRCYTTDDFAADVDAFRMRLGSTKRPSSVIRWGPFRTMGGA